MFSYINNGRLSWIRFVFVSRHFISFLMGCAASKGAVVVASNNNGIKDGKQMASSSPQRPRILIDEDQATEDGNIFFYVDNLLNPTNEQILTKYRFRYQFTQFCSRSRNKKLQLCR